MTNDRLPLAAVNEAILLKACNDAIAWLTYGVTNEHKTRAQIVLEQALADIKA